MVEGLLARDQALPVALAHIEQGLVLLLSCFAGGHGTGAVVLTHSGRHSVVPKKTRHKTQFASVMPSNILNVTHKAPISIIVC